MAAAVSAIGQGKRIRRSNARAERRRAEGYNRARTCIAVRSSAKLEPPALTSSKLPPVPWHYDYLALGALPKGARRSRNTECSRCHSGAILLTWNAPARRGENETRPRPGRRVPEDLARIAT
jgi:hypothetical protein